MTVYPHVVWSVGWRLVHLHFGGFLCYFPIEYMFYWVWWSCLRLYKHPYLWILTMLPHCGYPQFRHVLVSCNMISQTSNFLTNTVISCSYVDYGLPNWRLQSSTEEKDIGKIFGVNVVCELKASITFLHFNSLMFLLLYTPSPPI